MKRTDALWRGQPRHVKSAGLDKKLNSVKFDGCPFSLRKGPDRRRPVRWGSADVPPQKRTSKNAMKTSLIIFAILLAPTLLAAAFVFYEGILLAGTLQSVVA